MGVSILLITPPFTQLNTPYPATAYLKGFLQTRGISAFQADLGIEVTLALFSKKGLETLFARVEDRQHTFSGNTRRIYSLKQDYLDTIDATIRFLQGRNPSLAHFICNGEYLPRADRFAHTDDLEHAFGNMGIQDKAKHLATMYLEDLSDFIKECVDDHFGFSRYAERLGRSANTFDTLYESLQQPYTLIDELLMEKLKALVEKTAPAIVALSVPFPGNLYSAFRCGQWIKNIFHP